MVSTERLKKLGLTKASDTIEETKKFNRQCVIAYEHFRYVTPEKIAEFNADIREKTIDQKQGYSTYDTLKFTKLDAYPEVPPSSVLDLLEKAQDKKCFDYFEIAKIESVEERPDPILFGRIEGCVDRFFIGQWDSDVKIEDILEENEG